MKDCTICRFSPDNMKPTYDTLLDMISFGSVPSSIIADFRQTLCYSKGCEDIEDLFAK